MKTLLALDSFKGCLTASEAVEAAASALPCGQAVSLPLSDGGEGFTDCLVSALGGTYCYATVHDSIGRPVKVKYGLVHNGRTAVVETAAASGITCLEESERNPLIASSYGTGELIKYAVEQCVEQIYIGLGGTATMDCGSGLLKALGTLPPTVRIHAFYDVDIPLMDAPALFGPQKGADEAAVLELERRFLRQIVEWKSDFGVDANLLPGAGAAGGIGAALSVCLGATMHEGINAVLEAVCFPERLEGCGLVITGEGKADRQTLSGKVPFGVLRATRKYAPGTPVVLMAGKVEDREALLSAGFDAVLQVTPEEQMKGNYLEKSLAMENLRHAVRSLQNRD